MNVKEIDFISSSEKDIIDKLNSIENISEKDIFFCMNRLISNNKGKNWVIQHLPLSKKYQSKFITRFLIFAFTSYNNIYKDIIRFIEQNYTREERTELYVTVLSSIVTNNNLNFINLILELTNNIENYDIYKILRLSYNADGPENTTLKFILNKRKSIVARIMLDGDKSLEKIISYIDKDNFQQMYPEEFL